MRSYDVNKARVIKTYGMSLEEKLTALSLQGIVNRESPRIFVKANFWNWPPACDKWIEYLQSKKGWEFEDASNLPELVALFRDKIAGLVVWDPRVQWSKWIAVTMAGVKNLLPVAPECAERYGLPVVEDLRGRWKTDLEAATWAVRNLIRECNRDIAYSIEATWSGATIDSLDYAVRERAFVYCLAHDKKAEEVSLAHELMSRIGPCAPIFGWGEPEDRYCEAVSFHDNYIMCAEAPNLSFFAGVPCEREEWSQPARKDPSSFVLENKHYIAINMSEGDSPKMHYALQGGSWFDPNRGKVPVNWGAQPLLLKFFPAMLEFYWDTATDNDYFVGGPSGAGYTYPNLMPNPDPFFKQTGEYFNKADITETDVWMHFNRSVYERYAEISGVKAFMFPGGPYGVTLINDGQAVAFFRGNSGLNYFDAKGTPESLATAVKQHCGKRCLPSFSVAFVVPDAGHPAAQGGYSPSDILKLQELLGPDYKITTMQEMTELAIQALKSGKCSDCQSPGYSEWD